MIYLKSIRINSKNKTYRKKVEQKHFLNIDDMDQHLQKVKEDFIKERYTDKQISIEDIEKTKIYSTHVTIPDKEYLYYLVVELHLKHIPQEVVKMLRSKKK